MSTLTKLERIISGGINIKIDYCRETLIYLVLHDASKNNFHCGFLIRAAELRWNFSSLLRDASDIHRFPTVHMVETHFLLENLLISEPSLGILEKFQCSSALPNIKYNRAVLFWSQLHWVLFMLLNIFSHRHQC